METYIKVDDLNYWISKHFKGKDLITIEDLINCIEELDNEIYDLNEKVDKLNNDIKEYYRPIPMSSLCGVSDKDFA